MQIVTRTVYCDHCGAQADEKSFVPFELVTKYYGRGPRDLCIPCASARLAEAELELFELHYDNALSIELGALVTHKDDYSVTATSEKPRKKDKKKDKAG